MKSIELKTEGSIKTADIVKLVVSTDSQRGIKFAEMRQRNKILDTLETANGSLELEDSEYALLKSIVQDFPFAVANKDLESVLAGIIEA